MERSGFTHNGGSKLRVVVACGSKRHHRCIGKDGSVLARPEIKWSLNVAIALSAAFIQWRCGGTSWNDMPLERKCSLSFSGHSLSNICTCGVNPLLLRYLCKYACVFTISACNLFFIGSVSIALLLLLYITIMYLFHLFDVIRKRPV